MNRSSLIWATTCVVVLLIALLNVDVDASAVSLRSRIQARACARMKAKYTLSFHRYTADQAYLAASGSKSLKPITTYMDILSRINTKDLKKQSMVLQGNIPIQRINLLLGISYPDMPVEAFRPIDEKDSLGEIRAALERVVLINKDESVLQSVGHIVKSLGDLGTMKESHFGDKQHWHAMDSGGKTNGDVRNTILTRVKELYQEFRKADRNARFWYIGQILHCVQDSFSDAHAARDIDDPKLPLLFFQDYKAQNGKLHGVADINIEEGECEAQFEMKGNANLQHLWKTSDIHRIKRVLWERALKLSTELFKKLENNAKTHSGSAEDIWDKTLKSFFENEVFNFKSTRWENAKPGGSLPLYAKDTSVARRRDQIEIGGSPSQSSSSTTDPNAKTLFISELLAGDLPSDRWITSADPFAVIDVNGHSVTTAVKTNFKGGSEEISWKIDREFKVGPKDELSVKLYDSDSGSKVDMKKAKLMGEAIYKVQDFGPLAVRSRKNLKSPAGNKGYVVIALKSGKK